MAIDLGPGQFKALRDAGYSIEQIKRYQLGQQPTFTAFKMAQFLKGASLPPISQTQQAPGQDRSWQTVPSSTPPKNPQGLPTYSTGPGWQTVPNSVLPRSSPPGDRSRSGAPGIPRQPTYKPTPALDRTPNATTGRDRVPLGGYPDVAPTSSSEPIPPTGVPDPNSLPTAPGAPPVMDIDIPIVESRPDVWYPRGKELAAAAYAPFYESIEKGRGNARTNQQRSDELVKGLYGNLVGDINASGQQQAQQYDQSGAEAAARAQALEQKLASIYAGTTQDQAGLAAQIGQAPGAQAIAGLTGNESAFQRGEAATQGAAQQDYYAKGKQAALDYTTGNANAQATAGTVARQDLITDLNNVLAQFDAQEAEGKVSEGRSGLEVGGQLTERDLSAQSTNAGNTLQGLGLQSDQQWRAYQAQVDAYNTANQANADRAENERRVFEADRQYELDFNDFKLRSEALAMEARQELESKGADTPFPGSPSGDFKDAPTDVKIAATAEAIEGAGRGQEYVALMNSVIGDEGFTLDDENLWTFKQKVAEKAKASGLSPTAAAAAADYFWIDIMNRR